jgi:hypothetical protein
MPLMMPPSKPNVAKVWPTVVASAQPPSSNTEPMAAAVAAHEAAGHEDGEPCRHSLEHRGNEDAAEHKGHAVLEYLGGAIEHERISHAAEHILEAALAASSEVHGGEQYCDEDAGITGCLGAQGHPIQAERPQNDADEAGNESRGDEQVLQQGHAGANDLRHYEQSRHDAHVESQVER